MPLFDLFFREEFTLVFIQKVWPQPRRWRRSRIQLIRYIQSNSSHLTPICTEYASQTTLKTAATLTSWPNLAAIVQLAKHTRTSKCPTPDYHRVPNRLQLLKKLCRCPSQSSGNQTVISEAARLAQA